MAASHGGTILTYEYIDYTDPTSAFRPYDDRFPAVAARVIAMIGERVSSARVEHVGSSAVPGCAGKGVIDLMVSYPPGELEAARDAVDGLGFQRQTNRDPFPEERPVRVGMILHDGDPFRVHVHIIAADSPETAEQLRFRDRLRADRQLMEDYVAIKKSVLMSGVADSGEYNRGKDALIKRILHG